MCKGNRICCKRSKDDLIAVARRLRTLLYRVCIQKIFRCVFCLDNFCLKYLSYV